MEMDALTLNEICIDSAATRLVGWEAGAGPTVVFLHAGAERSDVWQPVVRRLLGTCAVRCVAIDQRAHGRSGGEARLLSEYGDDVAAVLAAVLAGGTGPCAVVGASLGGMAVMDALRHASVRRVLAGVVLVDVVPDPDPARARAFLAAQGLLESGRRGLVDDVLARSGSLRASLSTAGLPVLLVRGAESILGDDEVDRLAGLLPDLQVRTVAGAGHLVARDAPLDLADVIGPTVTRWLTAPV